MCIIIAKPAGVDPVPKENLERAWEHNKDGGGVVFFRPGDKSAYMKKGMMNKDEFLSYLGKLNKKENAFIAHFRIMSRGKVCKTNTHPFCYEHITFAHNGTLTIEPRGDKTDSETFGDCFFTGKTMNWIKASKDLIEFTIGNSKFAVMDNHTGEIFILNANKGKTENGAWYSNESAFATYSNYKSYGNTTNYSKTSTAVSGATSSTPTLAANQTKFSPSEIQEGVVESTVGTFAMDKYRLGTAYWHPNKAGVKYDTFQRHWINDKTGVVFGPSEYSDIIYSREGLYKLALFDIKGLEPVTQNNQQPSCLPYLRKALWDETQAKLQDLRKCTDYDEVVEGAEEVRVSWLVCNTIHRMVSSNVLVNMKNLDKLLFDVCFMPTQPISSDKKYVNITTCLDALREEIEEYFDASDKKALAA